MLAAGGDSQKLVPAKRQITIRDLFRHTTGYSYGSPGSKEHEYYRHGGVLYRAPHGMMPPEMTIEEAAEALAPIPALHQPGERFTYGFNTEELEAMWHNYLAGEFQSEKVKTTMALR